MGESGASTNIRVVPVATLASGADLVIHLHEIAGRLGDGPTAGICAAIHGDEPTGTQVAQAVARRFASGEFRGRLLVLPVANPPAFEANSRHSPVDDLNLNRLFPGNPAGWVSEKLAGVIARELLDRVDLFIDLHAGGDRATVDYIYIRNAEHLSRAFGSPVLYRPDSGKAGTMFSGTSVGVTEARGVPSVVVELGGGRVDQRPYVRRGVDGVTNVLRTHGLLDGDADVAPEQLVVDSITTVRPSQGGWLEPAAPPLGATIDEGASLGRVVSPYTFEVLEEIVNPIPKGVMILSHLTRNLVQPGDYGFMVGSAEP